MLENTNTFHSDTFILSHFKSVLAKEPGIYGPISWTKQSGPVPPTLKSHAFNEKWKKDFRLKYFTGPYYTVVSNKE